MAVPTAVVKEFIRRVYRVTAESDQTRDDFLDGLADTALEAWEKGKTLSEISGNGQDATYQLFFGWSPTVVLDVINQARDVVSNATLAEALTALKPVRHLSRDFSNIAK